MKEKLSALVDNEIDELDQRRVLGALAEDAALRRTWDRYHLVRAALRKELEFVVAPGLAERIAEEINMTSARAGSVSPRTFWRRAALASGTVAIAASVAAVAIFGLQWVRAPIATQQLAAQSKPTPAQVARAGAMRWDTTHTEAENALNAYLVEHNEFASHSGFGGMAPYVRVVSYDNDK
ncbi:MAG: sigma-E factor negative regulatory protein [Pseudomonadota bacterium]